jgi:hypothetical protein
MSVSDKFLQDQLDQLCKGLTFLISNNVSAHTGGGVREYNRILSMAHQRWPDIQVSEATTQETIGGILLLADQLRLAVAAKLQAGSS